MHTTQSTRVVLATNGFLIGYPQGGGHWAWFLQYPLGLLDLRHDVYCLELMTSTGDAQRDARLISTFLSRLESVGMRDRCCILIRRDKKVEWDFNALSGLTTAGMPAQQFLEVAANADMVWNIAGSLKSRLLSLFKHRVLVDVDPGVYQVSAVTWNMGLQDHDRFLSVGTKFGQPDCLAPTVGVVWRPFLPFVFLPAWKTAPP